MSMWLMLAKIEVGLLEAVRADPQLIETLLWQDEGPIPDGLSAAFDAESDGFEADYRTLSAIAEVMPSKEWFDKATSGTEELDYHGFTYGPAFAFSPQDVSAVAAGLIAEGWHTGSAAEDLSLDDDDDDDGDEDDEDLAAFFITAAAQGRAVVGGVN